jgi:hypothetical protein
MIFRIFFNDKFRGAHAKSDASFLRGVIAKKWETTQTSAEII